MPDFDAYATVLLLRFVLVNVVALGLLALTWQAGWLGVVMRGDTSGLVWLIVAVFGVGLAWAAHLAARLSRELDAARRTVPPTASLAARYADRVRSASDDRQTAVVMLRLRLAARIAPVRRFAATLVVLGLIGTVIGFIVALLGVDPQEAGDVTAITPMVSTLIEGMGIALHTTLVGAVLSVWLNINVALLEGGAMRLLAAIVER